MAALRLTLSLWIHRNLCTNVSVLSEPRFPRGGGGSSVVGFRSENSKSNLGRRFSLGWGSCVPGLGSGGLRWVRGLGSRRLRFVRGGCCCCWGVEGVVCGWIGTI